MKRFYLIIFLFSSLMSLGSYGKVEIECQRIVDCKGYQNKIEEISHRDIDINKKIEELRSLARDETLQEFSFSISLKDNEYSFHVLLKGKMTISTIDVLFAHGSGEGLEGRIDLKEGSYLDVSSLEQAKSKLITYLSTKGYIGVEIETKLSEKGNEVKILLKVKYEGKKIIDKVILTGGFRKVSPDITQRLMLYEGELFDQTKLSHDIEKINQRYRETGNYFSKVIMKTSLNNNLTNIDFNFYIGNKYNFDFWGNKKISTEDLLLEIKQNILNSDGDINEEKLKNIINDLYEKRGIYYSKITTRKQTGKYKNGIPLVNYYITLKEGEKIKIKELIFQGNSNINVDELKALFYEKSSSLVYRGFYDKDYIDKFVGVLKTFYFKRGFIFAEVEKNIMNNQNNGYEIQYTVKEKIQCEVQGIILKNIPADVGADVKRRLTNKIGQPLDIIKLQKDLHLAQNIVKERGFYFSFLKNIKKKNIISYSSNSRNANLFLDFKIGKKTVFNKLLISGNRKTDKIVIERENIFKFGEIITPKKIEIFRERISSLGLFSKITINPIVINKFSNDEVYRTNILIHVLEKKFGSGEVAPGYRTDLGAKLSLSLSYKNLFGLNHSLAFRTQLNRRFSLGDLDNRRKGNDHHRIELLVGTSYSWPYLFNFFDFDISSSFQRKRFYSFDADILQISPRLIKEFNDYFVGALRYQLEDIRQSDASNEKDQARFRIGGLTPSFTLDFRDNPVSPKQGSFFNLSWEFSNPWLASQKEDNLEINYSKIISRNRFYIPFRNKTFILAMSLSAGYQVNYADELVLDDNGETLENTDGTLRSRGYIPPIKVFRLDGHEVVRGFAGGEINRLNNGTNIHDLRIQNSAYFSNIKIEPRYYVNDSIAFGLFFDAGSLFVNHFKPFQLRSAIGGSFKFLTPVGSLDFDYGIKVKRRTLNDGGREGFGRFHLSIGLF